MKSIKKRIFRDNRYKLMPAVVMINRTIYTIPIQRIDKTPCIPGSKF